MHYLTPLSKLNDLTARWYLIDFSNTIFRHLTNQVCIGSTFLFWQHKMIHLKKVQHYQL